MEKEQGVITIEDVLNNADKYISNEDEIKVINDAYKLAHIFHDGKKKPNGDEYINHLLNIAYILTIIQSDSTSLAASLLHECDLSYDEIKDKINVQVADVVKGVQKLNRLSISADSEYLINYYKKILIGLCEDVRVIIIKLADRLQNMRTLYNLPEAEQKVRAKETLEILAPIAHHLGIHYLKSELEDLSLRYYKSDVYHDIVKNLNNTKVERDNSITLMKEKIGEILKENGIKSEIKGRSKSIYSIYTKMLNGKRFNEIYDILALRVYVSTEAECYLALGLIHSKFKPFAKRFKDYIAMPKENLYQSLHTTIFGIDGFLFEVQIRTYDMDKIAEYGIASHWAYKENVDASVVIKNIMEQKLQVFRNIIESNKNNDVSSEDFMNSFKTELVNNMIYVYTPKGDVIELPIGSTPIDFAYKVHTHVGDKMVGAIINNNIVPLDYELKDGDIIKINVNNNSKGPSKEWLKIAKTTQARNRIKSFYTKIDKEYTIKKGQELIEKELRKLKLPFSDFNSTKNIEYLLEELNEDTIEDIFLCVGNNKYAASYIVNLIYKETKTKEEIVLDKMTTSTIRKSNNKNDIIVSGIDEIKVTLASCCRPIKGDEIIGYITKGNGITIHRSNCHNILNTEERIISVEWNEEVNNKYSANVLIKSEKNDHFLLNLISKASSSNISIQTINTNNNYDYISYDLVVLVENTEKLNKFINDVYQMSYVISAERIIK